MGELSPAFVHPRVRSDDLCTSTGDRITGKFVPSEP